MTDRQQPVVAQDDGLVPTESMRVALPLLHVDDHTGVVVEERVVPPVASPETSVQPAVSSGRFGLMDTTAMFVAAWVVLSALTILACARVGERPVAGVAGEQPIGPGLDPAVTATGIA